MFKRQYKVVWLSVAISLGILILWAGCSNNQKLRMISSERERSSFDKEWRFNLLDSGTDDTSMGLEKSSLDDSAWRVLNLPHDWAIEGGFSKDLPNHTGKLPFAGIGWYRKHFTIPVSDSGKRIFIDFDGAMSHTKVWLNDEYVGQWPYGYASFRLELTPYVKFGGENVLAVRLDNPDNSSRWYPGGGIYRHTWLVKMNPVHVAHWGTYVTTSEASSESATVNIQTEVENQSDQSSAITVQHTIGYADTPYRLVAEVSSEEYTVAGQEIKKIDTSVIINNPTLWSIENPALYTIYTTVKNGSKILDTLETPFGIRTAKFDAKKGFLLNGERLYLKGVCLHHDLGPLGTAVHRRGIERQLEILKEMGCNSIRTSHNPPAPELLEFCDKMGLVVLDEAFDCWANGKTSNDYGTLFTEWHEKDVTALVRRDRNHPSVIAWSSGNEIGEQGYKSGHELSSHLTSIFHRLDPTRPVTAGCNYPQAPWNGFADTIDVYGFNYKPHLYYHFREHRPDQAFYSSESASCISSRGEYFFPVSEKTDEGFFNYQVSSYDLYAPYWAMTPDREFIGQDENHPSCAGEYVWTGFDYLGEPTPYNTDKTIALNFHSDQERKEFEKVLAQMDGKAPSRSSYFGIIDLCGFPKDRFYMYQARWRPEVPMAHILPHWNWPERVGKITPVHVYTSGDEAELFLNSTSLGRKKKRIGIDDTELTSVNLADDKPATFGSYEFEGDSIYWWQVDLGKIQLIRSAFIYWTQYRKTIDYVLKVSKDNQNWITVAERNSESTKKFSMLTFEEEARYIRLEFPRNNTFWQSFCKLRVFNDSSPHVAPDNPNMNIYRLRWDDVVYEPGELKVIAYKDGQKWAEDVMKTTGDPAKLKLSPDREVIKADGRDLSYITLKVIDESGLMVPRSNPKISYSIEGPGEIVATGNGNAIDHTSFLSKERNAYNGLCLVIVRSIEGRPGTVRIKAESETLVPAETTIISQ